MVGQTLPDTWIGLLSYALEERTRQAMRSHHSHDQYHREPR
ncbi:MAG: hypothetical protein RIE73_11075 [Coleofasciculus sp. C1-SOL-03]